MKSFIGLDRSALLTLSTGNKPSRPIFPTRLPHSPLEILLKLGGGREKLLDRGLLLGRLLRVPWATATQVRRPPRVVVGSSEACGRHEFVQLLVLGAVEALLLVLHVPPTGRHHTVGRGGLARAPALHVAQTRADVVAPSLGEVADRTAGSHGPLEVGPLHQLTLAHHVAEVCPRGPLDWVGKG